MTKSNPAQKLKRIRKPPIYKVTCADHGERIGGLICRHMCEPGSGKGFYSIEATPDDPSGYLGWCHACEVMLEDVKNRSWAHCKEARDLLRPVCDICFEKVRAAQRLRLVR
jgi:hypothetical protein